jgi:curli biogenesis system outer membrane secretion channel CsgG
MNKTALALALTFALAGPMAAFAQTATPATPATPAKPATQAQTPKAKVDCTKAENKAKAECKTDAKATDKKS